jgi:hypothetical protein
LYEIEWELDSFRKYYMWWHNFEWEMYVNLRHICDDMFQWEFKQTL